VICAFLCHSHLESDYFASLQKKDSPTKFQLLLSMSSFPLTLKNADMVHRPDGYPQLEIASQAGLLQVEGVVRFLRWDRINPHPNRARGGRELGFF
jgi:hypothetical protein